MATHRAALYTVRVHEKRKPKAVRTFGNYDGAKTDLADILNGFVAKKFFVENATKDRSARGISSTVVGDEVRTTFEHGLRGTAADINDPSGKLKARQDIVDTSLVKCGSLFYLPNTKTVGFWGVHVNNGRSAKTLIQAELVDRFNKMHDDLTLKIEPCVNEKAIREAVARGRIDKVRLTRLEKPASHTVAATKNWVHGTDQGTLELTIKGEAYLKAENLKAFFAGKKAKDVKKTDAARSRILEFEGMEFEKASVEVELASGQQRTFNIESPEAGHAFTVDLAGIKLNNAGDPTAATLFKSLRDAIDDLG